MTKWLLKGESGYGVRYRYLVRVGTKGRTPENGQGQGQDGGKTSDGRWQDAEARWTRMRGSGSKGA